MFIDRLLSQGNVPLLEQVVQFTSVRHRLIAENIANVDTPGYRQKDLSVSAFQQALRNRIDRRQAGEDVRFDDVQKEAENPMQGILFHDRNNRSMEQLTTDLAKNAMMHNLAIELLRKQYLTMETALKERIA
ncbi:MAG: flagellar basal body rod protein FlgB [Bacillota bacterium]